MSTLPDTLDLHLEFIKLYNTAHLMNDEELIVEIMYINDVELGEEIEQILAKYFTKTYKLDKLTRHRLNTFFALYYVDWSSNAEVFN